MSKQVLIVEDEAVLSRNLSSALEHAGLVARCAPSISAAKRALTEAECDLLCLDVRLGDGDGLEFMASLRKTRPDLPVVVMTGEDCVSNRLRAEGCAASAFLAKPFALTRFQDLVVTLLRDRAALGAKTRPRRGPSVLMYSHDTIGLGHMRRNSAIAARIVDAMPEASVLMLVGSPAGAVFELPPGVDFIKLPALVKVARDVWRPGGLRISADATRELRSGLIERAVETFRPDVLVVDHEPAGVWDELVPMLRSLRAKGDVARVILGLRDILDEPERTKESWEKRGVDRIVREFYDDILVYGGEELFPSREIYGLDALTPDRVRYCGYVTTTPATAPGRGGPPAIGPRRLIVTGGGGRDAFPMMNACLTALTAIAPARRPETLFVTGPLMDAELRANLKSRAEAAGAAVHTTEADIPALLRGADLFVTMGGYNSLVEAMAVGCPTLVIPRVGPSSEQRMRAELLAGRGLVETLSAAEASAERLAERFQRIERRARLRPADLPLEGARRAAEFIIEALLEAHPSSPLTEERRAAHA